MPYNVLKLFLATEEDLISITSDYIFVCVTNMQCGNSIVTNVDDNKSQVGLVFRDFNKKDLKSGDMLTFKKEK